MAAKLAVGIVCFLTVAGVLAAHPPSLPVGVSNHAVAISDCSRGPGELLVELDTNGMNNSIRQGQFTLHLIKGEAVTILLCNLDQVQSHGFAIGHYFDTGVTLRPGEAYKLSFTARDAGNFVIYCNAVCTVHQSMLGKLTVT